MGVKRADMSAWHAATSELVRLFEPQDAVSAPRFGCPHLTTGLRRWEDASTWPNGRVPGSNEDATLPTNSKVLLASTTARLGLLTIPPSSALIFGEVEEGVALYANGIAVFGALAIALVVAVDQ